MKRLGKLDVGVEVEAAREEGDDEFERCTVRKLDAKAATVDLSFPDGFVRKGTPLHDIKFLPESQADSTVPESREETEARAAAEEVLAKEGQPAASTASSDADAEADAAYAAEVGSQLPPPPTKEALAADEETKYAYVKAYKDAGNALFKAGKYAWAIRTYCDAVDALQRHCYESRERMLWDYFARGPCGQCYSNAALCALKLGDAAQAAALCGRAMECKPEDADLVKVLLRHGQAHMALGAPEEAKRVLEKALDKEPNNRAAREELAKAKKAVKAQYDKDAAALFASVDLHKKGLTSKKEAAVEQLRSSLDAAFEHLVEHRDDEALRLLEPLMSGKQATAEHRKPSTLLAAYGCGVAFYQKQRSGEAIAAFELFFELKAELDANGVDYTPPLMGLPLVRFYYAHALFESQRLPQAKEQLGHYFADVEAAGPVRILNMPASMLGGKVVTDTERAASRFKKRASSAEAQADACTMLAIIAERLEGPDKAVPHFLRCIELSNEERQQAEAHQNLAATYKKLGEQDKASEHYELARTKREAAEKKEEEARRKKEEEDKAQANADEQEASEEEEGKNGQAPPEEASADEGYDWVPTESVGAQPVMKTIPTEAMDVTDSGTKAE